MSTTGNTRRWFPRVRFQFSLRTLFVVVSITCAWLAWQLNWINQRHRALDKHIGVAAWPSSFQVGNGALIYRPRPNAPVSLRWLGENGYSTIYVTPLGSSAELDRIGKLFPEARVTAEPCPLQQRNSID